jgi:hypothetical protein
VKAAGGDSTKANDFMTLVWKSNTKIGIGYQLNKAKDKYYVVFWLCPGITPDFKAHRSGTTTFTAD